MTWAWAEGARPRPALAARIAALARAILASGLLPVFPRRAVRYDPGPLRRAAKPAREAGHLRAKLVLWQTRAGEVAGPAATAASLLLLGSVVALSRARLWRRAHPLWGARSAGEFQEAARLAFVIRSSRARRWRRTNLPWLAAGPWRRTLFRAREHHRAPATSRRERFRVPARHPTTTPEQRRPVPRATVAARAPLPVSRAPQKGRSEARLFAGVGVAALFAVIAAAYLPGLVEPAQRAGADGRTLAPPPSPADVAPSLVAEPARVPAPAKLQAEPVAPRPAAVRPEAYRISWPFDIADGITFGPEGAQKTRLAGVEAPPRDAVCNDRNGQPWACGLQARALLNNVTRRQNLTCEPVAEPAGGVVPARCKGDVDVARELVLAGFARPASPDPALDAAAREAQRGERGLWNGGWTIRTAIR